MTIKKSYQGTFIPQTLEKPSKSKKGKGVNIDNYTNKKLYPKNIAFLKKITGGGFQKIE